MPVPDSIAGSNDTWTAGDTPVLFSARPEALSFLYRYLLSFTPVVLVILCMGIRGIQDSLFLAASHTVPALSPVPAKPASNISSAAMAQYLGVLNTSTPGLGELAALMILLIAPVGIFLLAAGIGSSLRKTEVWTGPALTLILSSCTAYVLAGSSSFSMAYLVLFLQWVAFLVQPFSILASVLVLWGTEKFRRSIEYTITPDAVVIRGGVFKHKEQTIPHHHIGGVIFEQDLIGSRFNYGTVIPQSTASRNAAFSFWGIVTSERKDNADPGAGNGGSIGTSRDPLDCFFGIPDPKTARQILERMMDRPVPRDE
jgi:membrane protein YdbS with pleckstrin-like domain